MENNKIFCFNLKLKAENLIACTSKEDLIELIRQSEDCQVEPIHSTLIEMARRKKIKNHTILTKYELRKALGLTTENKPRSKSYIFSKSPEERALNLPLRKRCYGRNECLLNKTCEGN